MSSAIMSYQVAGQPIEIPLGHQVIEQPIARRLLDRFLFKQKHVLSCHPLPRLWSTRTEHDFRSCNWEVQVLSKSSKTEAFELQSSILTQLTACMQTTDGLTEIQLTQSPEYIGYGHAACHGSAVMAPDHFWINLRFLHNFVLVFNHFFSFEPFLSGPYVQDGLWSQPQKPSSKDRRV